MIKRTLITIVVMGLAVTSTARADEEDKRVVEPGKWYPTVETGVTLSQSAFSNNWSGGDKGSVVWTAILNASLENQVHSKVNWYSILKLAYGQTHQQKADALGARSWERPEKSTDLIDLETIFRFTFGGWVDPYASGRFESQFEDASDLAGRSLSLSPMKFKQSGGMARKFFDEEEQSLLLRLGFTVRESKRSFFTGPAPDVSTASETSVDGGIEWTTDYKSKILNDRVAWTSKFTAYKPVFFSGSSEFDAVNPADYDAAGLDRDIGDFAMVVDIDWENIFTTQITKLLSVNLYTRWVYDKYDNSVLPKIDGTGQLGNADGIRAAIRKAGQFKQTMAVGITYRFL